MNYRRFEYSPAVIAAGGAEKVDVGSKTMLVHVQGQRIRLKRTPKRNELLMDGVALGAYALKISALNEDKSHG